MLLLREDIIIDTLLETVCPLTQEELSGEIASLFHVLVSTERLNSLINTLAQEGIVFFNSQKHIEISPVKRADFIFARSRENKLREETATLWIDYICENQDVSDELKVYLSQALPVFLRSLFVKHGVSSYELLTSTENTDFFGLDRKSVV